MSQILCATLHWIQSLFIHSLHIPHWSPNNMTAVYTFGKKNMSMSLKKKRNIFVFTIVYCRAHWHVIQGDEWRGPNFLIGNQSSTGCGWYWRTFPPICLTVVNGKLRRGNFYSLENISQRKWERDDEDSWSWIANLIFTPHMRTSAYQVTEVVRWIWNLT